MLQLNQLYLIHQRALDFGRDQSKSDRKCLCDFVPYIFFAGVSICCNRSEDEYNLYSSLCGVDEVHLCGNVPLHHHHCPQCSHYPQVIFYLVRIFHYGKKKITVESLKDKIHLALEAKINEIFLKRLIQTLETSSTARIKSLRKVCARNANVEIKYYFEQHFHPTNFSSE